MNDDKRVSPRFIFSEPVAYGVPDITVNGSVARNISLSGISLKLQGLVPVGTILELQIRSQQSPKVIWLKAKVIRLRELSEDCYEAGLKFMDNDESRRAVGRLILAGLNQQTE
jgi:PilZ domain